MRFCGTVLVVAVLEEEVVLVVVVVRIELSVAELVGAFLPPIWWWW